MKKYSLIGAATGFGSRRPETVDGPQSLRGHKLLERLQAIADVTDAGDVVFNGVGIGSAASERFRHAPEIRGFAGQLYLRLSEVVEGGAIPIVVGGDHSLSVGTLSGLHAGLSKRLGRPAQIGLLWVDAHADVNTPETTVSGNSHGMPVATLLGHGDEKWRMVGGRSPILSHRHVAFVGLRDLDPPEKEFLRAYRMFCGTMHDIDQEGIGSVLARALDVVGRARDGFVVSMDLDVCDPTIAPGVGTPVRGGLSFRESHLVMEMVSQSPFLRGIELVEYNPERDRSGATGELGVALLESALGKCIL